MNINTILARCTRDGACLLWGGFVTKGGLPVNYKRSVRRVIYEATYGPLSQKWRVVATCDNPLCVEVLHLKKRRAAELAAEASRNSIQQHSVTTMRVNRARSDRTIEQIRAFRADVFAGMSIRGAARKHGFSNWLAWKIARNRIWRDGCADSSVFNMRAVQ
jgi:hypothetical protein